MRFRESIRSMAALLLIAGCGEALPSVPETSAPEQPPPVPPGAALRPYFELAGKIRRSAGTVFVVEDKDGRLYMMSAFHVLDDDTWTQVQGVTLGRMGGKAVARTFGHPLYRGKRFQEKGASVDLVVWTLESRTKLASLKLAAEDANVNEWVWVIGQEVGSSGPEKLYRCRVTGTTSGGLSLKPHDAFNMRAFSGAPIVNAKGEVIGSLLGSSWSGVVASRVSSMRARLAEARIQVP